MLQDVIHAPPQQPQPPLPEEELANIDEISSPISSQILEFCENELFPETLQNSDVTSSSNCCYEDNSSYNQNISLALDVDTKFNNNNTITTRTSTNQANTTTTTNNNTTNNSNLSIIFDSQDEIDNDISASIDFSTSPAFHISPYLPVTTHQNQQFGYSSLQPQVTLAADSGVEGLAQYQTNPVVPPLMRGPLASVFEDDCLPSAPYMPMNSSSSSCSYLNPGMAPYMPIGPLNTALSTDGSGMFGGTILLSSDLQAHQELDYQGDNGGIYCPDSIQRVFNPSDLQALSADSQQLVAGAGGSTTLTPEISNLEDSTFKAAKISVEQRREKIVRYLRKRGERNFSKKIKYACRKTLADSRPRVRGRFAKNDDFGDTHRPTSSNHEEDDEEDVVVKEEDDMVDSSDIFAHISGVNSFKYNNNSLSIPSWI